MSSTRSLRLFHGSSNQRQSALWRIALQRTRWAAGNLSARAYGELRLWRLAAWRALVRLVTTDDLTHAASIAYYTLLSLVPFLLLAVSVLGLISSKESTRVAAVALVLRYFPAQSELMRSQLAAINEITVPFGVTGALTLTWASLGMFSAVTSAVNEAWGVEKRRSFLKHRLVSFVMLLCAGGTLILGVLVVTVVEVARASRFGSLLEQLWWVRTLEEAGLPYLATILFILGVGVVYYFIPNARTRFRDMWPGAVFTGILWHVAFAGFSWYVGYGQRLISIHGSIAAVVAFLMYVYISASVLLYGVEFTAAHARLRERRSEEMPAGPARTGG